MGWTALAFGAISMLLFSLNALFFVHSDGFWPTLCLFALIAALTGFAFSFLPFIGYSMSIRKLRNNQ